MQNIIFLSSVKNNVPIESDIIRKLYYQCAETASQARAEQGPKQRHHKWPAALPDFRINQENLNSKNAKNAKKLDNSLSNLSQIIK